MTSSFGTNATCPVCEKSYFKDQPWKRICLTCYLAHKKDAAPPQSEVTDPSKRLDRDMWRRLVQLCHPDKHDGSETSAIATRFLLGLRSAP